MQIDVISVSIGIIGILIGLMASYYFYRKSLRVKEPCWAIRSTNLIRDFRSRLSDLNISYKNQSVGNITISKILFWNNGLDTIDKNDIATINSLRVVASENTILLDVKIVASNNESSRINIRIDDDKKSLI